MNRITLDLEALRHNLDVVRGWVSNHGASLTVVTKALCGHRESILALRRLGVRSIADSRLRNLETVSRELRDTEIWYLRPPHHSAVPEIAVLAQVSLNSELETLRVLDEESRRLGKVHQAIIMIELGDLREGILPGSLVKFYKEVFDLKNVEVLGIGANLGCLSGSVPSVDQFMQLILYRELLELKFGKKLPLISAGSSVVLPLLLDGRLPKQINHFRVGESIFLGTDLVNGGVLDRLRNDAVTLEAEVIEIKEKGLVPLGETTDLSPFTPIETETPAPGQRGFRALIALGQLDTDVTGLTPVNPDYQIAGASSDITVVNIGDDSGGLKVGDTIQFRLAYSAFVRCMANRYTEKRVLPLPGDEKSLEEELESGNCRVPAVLSKVGGPAGSKHR
ncbi:MAG: alanine racemase [Acidobacteriota bacterium]